MDTTQNAPVNKMSAIDRALAAAKARRAASGEPVEVVVKPKAEKPAKEPKVKADKAAEKAQRDSANAELTALQKSAKAEKKAAEEAAKAERKAKRDAEREERRAAKAATSNDKKPSHMKKVERARAKCPSLGGEASRILDDATQVLSIQQLDALSQHLAVVAREKRTSLANSTKPLAMGATVRITGGEAKYIGMTGEVVHTNKLRAKVSVPGVRKPVYIYTGEAVPVSSAEAVSTAA